MSNFDDLDEFGPSNTNTDSMSTADLAATESAAFGTSTLLMVHSCSRIGLQASPLPGFGGWFRRR